MHTGEEQINAAMSEVLNDMRSDWRVHGEKKGKVLKSRHYPDIIITEKGAMPVIIETELMPASTLETDVSKKLGDYTTHGQKIESVIGIRIPSHLTRHEGRELRTVLKKTKELEYAAYTPERFPEVGWMTGGLADIASAAQIIAVNGSKVAESTTAMAESIDAIADLVEACGSDTRKKIAEKLYQKQTRQTWKMAGLILSNALIFHTHISGRCGIRTLMNITVLKEIPPTSLLNVWDDILKINYYAIFRVARDILSAMDDVNARKIIAELVEMTKQVNHTGLTHSTDMYGALIQKMIKDRKTLASFYTRPESAALLSGFVVPPPDSPIYANEESMRDVSMADLACGTGTLLASLYRDLIRNYEINGGDIKKIHADIVGHGIYGFDVLPSAAHLTASTLADMFPHIIFEVSRIATAFLGKYSDTLHLGSLDLISDVTTLDQKGILIIGSGEKPYYAYELHGMTFDIIIMNPPFTSNTREGGREGHALFSSFGIDKNTQRKMSNLEKLRFRGTCANGNAGYASNFIAIADKKLKPGGTLGLVLPATLAKGSAWAEARKLLKLKYKDLTIISVADTKHIDGSFSFDTNMNEILLIATKVGKAKHKKIKNNLERLRSVEKQIAAAKHTIKTQSDTAATLLRLRSRQTEKDKLEKYLRDAASSKRGLFVSLNHRPGSVLQAVSISKHVRNQADVLAYERGVTGATPITIGGKTFGSMLDCPLDDDWGFVNVYDAALLQCAYHLAHGKFQPIGDMNSYHVPMTILGNHVGPLSRDVADNKSRDKRAPFMAFPIDEAAIYPALSKNNAKAQRTLIVQPDTKAVPKTNASSDKIEKIAKTASRLHVNILCRYNSQCLAVLYTEKKTLCTGASLPNYYIKQKHEKAFVVWGNSTFGILCHWWHSSKQSFGRGITSSTAIKHMPMLDFESLTDVQISKFDELFSLCANMPLRTIMDMAQDTTRRTMDEGIMEILGIHTSLNDIRRRLSNEPTIRGHK